MADAGRDTMCANAEADPADVRYALVAEPGACEYCRMLDSRGYVYHSGRTAGSSCHAHCNCAIAVGFGGPGVSGSYDDPTETAHEWQEAGLVEPRSIAGVTRGREMTFDQADQGRPNPGFKRLKNLRQRLGLGLIPRRTALPLLKELEGYGINCQTCVVAYVARRRGFDVQASSRDKTNEAQERLARHTNSAFVDPRTGRNPDYIDHPAIGKGRRPSASEYIEWLDSPKVTKEGALYTFQFYWRGIRNSGWHILCVDRTYGVLRVYDPQTGESFKGADARRYVLEKPCYDETPRLLRVDDCLLDGDVADAILEGSRHD